MTRSVVQPLQPLPWWLRLPIFLGRPGIALLAIALGLSLSLLGSLVFGKLMLEDLLDAAAAGALTTLWIVASAFVARFGSGFLTERLAEHEDALKDEDDVPELPGCAERSVGGSLTSVAVRPVAVVSKTATRTHLFIEGKLVADEMRSNGA